VSHEEFHNLVINYPREDTANIEFMIYLHVEGGFWHFTNSALFSLDGFDKVFVAGTGTTDFIDQIEHVGAAPVGGTPGSGQPGVIRALGYTGLCATRQFASGFGISEGWGGGFEVATFDGNRFFKLSDILYLFWTIIEVGPHDFILDLGKPFLHQTYRGDQLVHWFESPDEHQASRLFLTDPPDTKNQAIDANPVAPSSFKIETIVNCVLRRRSGENEPLPGVFVQMNAPSAEPVRVQRKGNLQMMIDSTWLHTFFQEMSGDPAGVFKFRMWGGGQRFEPKASG
jgi:hypothetical protein